MDKRACADAGLRVTFNHYSPSRQYLHKVEAGDAHGPDGTFRLSTATDNLMLTDDDLSRLRDTVARAIEEFPETVVYSPFYNGWVNDPSPRFDIDPESGMATDCPVLNMPRHRQYHVDFTYSDDECCIANIDCSGCRHYVSGYTKIMAELDTHLGSADEFRGWVDVFDTWCRLHYPDWQTLD